MSASLSIGQVARRSGVGVETIRFYERKGLLPEPPRKQSGYRQYDGQAVSRLGFIQQAKALGFSLHEIGELLSLNGNPDATCHDVQARARAKLQDIDERIRKLKSVQRALRKLIDNCPGEGPLAGCPIIDALGRPA